MKRTKRYGGFLIGDRVKAKGYDKLNGEVVGFLNGYLRCVFDEITPRVPVVFAPNQLINLTRIEEQQKQKEIPELPPMSEETAKKMAELLLKSNEDLINKRAKESINLMAKDANDVVSAIFAPDPLPSPYIRDVYTTTNDY